MPTFLNAFFGTAAAKIGIALLGIVFTALGYDPYGITSKMVEDLVRWLSPEQARWAFFGFGIFLLLLWLALSIWLASRVGLGQRMSARQAVAYLVQQSRWGRRKWLEFHGHCEQILPSAAIVELRNAALCDDVHFRGRVWHQADHDDIDADRWHRIRINERSVADGTTNPGQTEPRDAQIPVPLTHFELSIATYEVVSLWPKAGWLFRLYIRCRRVLQWTWTLALVVRDAARLKWRRWKDGAR